MKAHSCAAVYTKLDFDSFWAHPLIKIEVKTFAFQTQNHYLFFIKKETVSPKKAKVILISIKSEHLRCHTTAILLKFKQNNTFFWFISNTKNQMH